MNKKNKQFIYIYTTDNFCKIFNFIWLQLKTYFFYRLCPSLLDSSIDIGVRQNMKSLINTHEKTLKVLGRFVV